MRREHPADKRAWPMLSIPGSQRGRVGMFNHDVAPAPFNPLYDPKAKARYAEVTASMERDGFYDSHTREECAAEWRRRYDALKEGGA